jgi:hypothetical protein
LHVFYIRKRHLLNHTTPNYTRRESVFTQTYPAAKKDIHPLPGQLLEDVYPRVYYLQHSKGVYSTTPRFFANHSQIYNSFYKPLERVTSFLASPLTQPIFSKHVTVSAFTEMKSSDKVVSW